MFERLAQTCGLRLQLRDRAHMFRNAKRNLALRCKVHVCVCV